MRVLPFFLILAVLVAGCSDDAPAVTPAAKAEAPAAEVAPNATAELEDPTVTFSMTRCKQLHGVFQASATDFEPAMPPGFTLSDSDGDGIIDVFVYPTHCEASRILMGNTTMGDLRYGDMMIFVAVVPPATDGSLREDYFSLDWILQQGDLEAALDGAGAIFTAGQASYADSAPGSVTQVTNWEASGGGLQFSVETVTSNPSGQFQNPDWRIWLADGDVAGFVDWSQEESGDDGVGAAIFTSNQAGGAPLALPGVAHRITDFGIVATFWPIDAVAWWQE